MMTNNMLQNLKQHTALYTALFVLVAVAVFLYHYPPDTITQYIGIENSYLATFLIAAIGGINSITSSVYYAAVATFSSGGANPWLLGIAGGIGIAIGDSIIFGLFSYGVKDIKASWKNQAERLHARLEKYPSWLTYVGIFIILGMTPVPNDIIMLALVLMGFSFIKVLPIILLAGFSITTLTALLGQSFSSFLFG